MQACTSRTRRPPPSAALGHLDQAAQPFTGKPRASDLWTTHFVHEVVHDAVALLGGADLEPALASINTISDGTTTSLMGMTGSGPIITSDLLAMLSKTVDRTGAAVALPADGLAAGRAREPPPAVPENVTFELEMARVSLSAGDAAEPSRCWERAARCIAAYGSHKNITWTSCSPSARARGRRSGPSAGKPRRVQPLTYLVAQDSAISEMLARWSAEGVSRGFPQFTRPPPVRVPVKCTPPPAPRSEARK